MDNLTDYEKIEYIHFAIQESMNGNADELQTALLLLELLREKAMTKRPR